MGVKPLAIGGGANRSTLTAIDTRRERDCESADSAEPELCPNVAFARTMCCTFELDAWSRVVRILAVSQISISDSTNLWISARSLLAAAEAKHAAL